MVSFAMILTFRNMKTILLCTILLSYAQEVRGDTYNNQDKDDFYHVNPDLIFLEIGNQAVSQQSLRNLNRWMEHLNEKKRNDIICFFDLLKKINHTPVEKNLCLIKKLDSMLKEIGIDPAVSDYIIYSIYLRQGERLANEDYFKRAYSYLEKSAQNGYEKAILEWAEYNLNSNASLDDIRRCVFLLKKIDSSDSSSKAMILLSRITLLYCYQNLTDIPPKIAFDTIFNNKNIIVSSSLNTLLEAGIMSLLIPELQQERDRAIVLLQEYVDKTENIDMLIKLIYVSNSANLGIGNISTLSYKKVNELIDHHDSRQLGSNFLSKRGWGDAQTVTMLNQGANFIDVCMEKFRETMKNKKLKIRQFIFFQ